MDNNINLIPRIPGVDGALRGTGLSSASLVASYGNSGAGSAPVRPHSFVVMTKDATQGPPRDRPV